MFTWSWYKQKNTKKIINLKTNQQIFNASSFQLLSTDFAHTKLKLGQEIPRHRHSIVFLYLHVHPNFEELHFSSFSLLTMEFSSSSVKSTKINIEYMYYVTVPSKSIWCRIWARYNRAAKHM